jgi:hypothetical protein
MEQIDDAERNLEWKENCDDTPTLCDADVLLAVDHGAPEAGLHWDFHPESTVWLDGGRMGHRAGLGLRGRCPAACFRDGRPSALLHSVRSDDRGAAFLPELRQAAVSRAISKSGSEMQPSSVIRATLSKPRLLERATMGAR